MNTFNRLFQLYLLLRCLATFWLHKLFTSLHSHLQATCPTTYLAKSNQVSNSHKSHLAWLKYCGDFCLLIYPCMCLLISCLPGIGQHGYNWQEPPFLSNKWKVGTPPLSANNQYSQSLPFITWTLSAHCIRFHWVSLTSNNCLWEMMTTSLSFTAVFFSLYSIYPIRLTTPLVCCYYWEYKLVANLHN